MENIEISDLRRELIRLWKLFGFTHPWKNPTSGKTSKAERLTLITVILGSSVLNSFTRKDIPILGHDANYRSKVGLVCRAHRRAEFAL